MTKYSSNHVWEKIVVFDSNTTDFDKSVVFDSNTTDFEKSVAKFHRFSVDDLGGEWC